jgi:hypothetical protein
LRETRRSGESYIASANHRDFHQALSFMEHLE